MTRWSISRSRREPSARMIRFVYMVFTAPSQWSGHYHYFTDGARVSRKKRRRLRPAPLLRAPPLRLVPGGDKFHMQSHRAGIQTGIYSLIKRTPKSAGFLWRAVLSLDHSQVGGRFLAAADVELFQNAVDVVLHRTDLDHQMF